MALACIDSAHMFTKLEWHPHPSVDVKTFDGIEGIARALEATNRREIVSTANRTNLTRVIRVYTSTSFLFPRPSTVPYGTSGCIVRSSFVLGIATR